MSGDIMAEKLNRTHASHEAESASLQVEAQTTTPEFANEFALEATLEPRARTMLSLQNTIGNQAVQRLVNRSQTTAPTEDDLAQRIQVASSGGHKLDAATRERLQASLGVDLSGVRVHLDNEADRLAESVEAVAFTTGNDVFFRSGLYQPETSSGFRLLAHEVTHTVQQGSGPVEGAPGAGGVSISDPADSHEREASAVADRIVAGQWSQVASPAAATVSRQIDDPFLMSSIPPVQVPVDPNINPFGPTELPPGNAPTEFPPGFLENPTFPPTPRVPNIPEPPPGGFPELPPTPATGAAAEGAAAEAGAVEAGAAEAGALEAGALEAGALEAGAGGAEVLAGGALAGEAGAGLGAAALPAAAVIGAGAAGVAAGYGLDQLSNYVGQQITGNDQGDYHISTGIGNAMTAVDQGLTSLWADPSKPEYTQTLGWKIANWLD